MKYLILLFCFFSLTVSANEKKKEETVKWKFYSKNKSHIYIDYKATPASTPENFGMLYTKDFAGVQYKNYSLGLRKTMVVFAKKDPDDTMIDHAYQYSNELFNHGWEHWLDRMSFSGKWKPVDFTVGDFYESMNRGMAFSMKNDPVYGDNSIRGGSINVHHKGFHMKTFGGRANPQIRDKATFQRTGEADDWLAGMELGYKWKKLDFGIQYGYANYGKYRLENYEDTGKTSNAYDRTNSEKEFHLTGAYISLRNPFPGFTFYSGAVYVPYGYENTTEENKYNGMDPLIDKEKTDLQNSAAFYSSALYYIDLGKKKSRLTFKLEAKLYSNYYLNYTRMEDADYKRRYFNPPTLLPMDLQMDNEFDTWAIGTKIAFMDKHLTKAKYSISFVKGNSLNNKNSIPKFLTELGPEYKEDDFYFVGTEGEKHFQKFNFTAKFGFHYSNGDKHPDPIEDNKQYWIISGLHLGGYVSKFSYKFNNDYYNKNMTIVGVKELDNAHELKTVLDLSWNNRYFLTLKNTYWHNDFSDNLKNWYPGAGIGFKYNTVKFYIFAGFEKGGLTCDGGSCRILPDFKGVKAELDVAL